MTQSVLREQLEVGMEMQIKLDGQSATLSMDVKLKVKALSSLRKIPAVNEKIHLDSVKLFNRLIIFAQWEMTVETSLQYELTPFPLSLFSNKRSEDEQGKQGRLFKDKPEDIN